MCRSGRVGPTRRSMNSFPSLPGPGLVLWGCGPGKGRGGEASWVERRSRDQGREAQPRGGPPRDHEEPLILLGLQRCPEGANLHVYGQLDPGSPPSWAGAVSGGRGPSRGPTVATVATWSQSPMRGWGGVIRPPACAQGKWCARHQCTKVRTVQTLTGFGGGDRKDQ